MKTLFENWRQYLTERYSLESSFAALKPNNKKMRNLYKRHINHLWYEDVEHGSLDPKWDPEPEVSEEKMNKAAAKYRSYILEIIPEDIWGPEVQTTEQKKRESDKNQGLAIMWVRKLSIENPKIARDIIEGEVAFTGHARGGYADIMPDLEIYFQNLDLMPKKNLMEVGSFEELHQMVEEAKEKIHARQQEKQYMDAEEGTEVLKDDEEMYIAALHNKGAACELGKGTDWCTAAPGLDYFEEYYKPDDPLFVFVPPAPAKDPDMPEFFQPGFKSHPGGEHRYQFHYGSNQFMDKGDREVSDELFAELHGLLMKTAAPQEYPIVQLYDWQIISYDRSTPPETLAALAENPDIPQDVMTRIAKNPSTPLETLRYLANSDNKFVKRAVQVNHAIDTELKIELFVNNIHDELIYSRGMDDVILLMREKKISHERGAQILNDATAAYEEYKVKRIADRNKSAHERHLSASPSEIFENWRRFCKKT